MRRNLFTGIGLAALAVVLSTGLIACNTEEVASQVYDINGVWEFELTPTTLSGACIAETDVSIQTITITQVPAGEQGSNVDVTMRGFLGEPGNVLTGGYSGDVTASGSYPEDGGTTTTSYTLTPITADQMTGTESWSFVNGASTCPDNVTRVVATRQ